MSGQTHTVIKLVAVGDGYVGKTSVLLSYIKQQFKQDYQPTIFDNHSVIVKSGTRTINLGLWDTAGQEEYSSLRPLAYSNCDIFMIVFSVTDKTSFQNAYLKWYKELERVSPNSAKIFVGNKTDLRDPNNTDHIKYELARKQLWDKLKVPYYQCSALTRSGVDQIFNCAIQVTLENRKKIMKKEKRQPCDCRII